MEPYLHIGCGPVVGPSWVNLDGDLAVLIGLLRRKYRWIDDKGKWLAWFGHHKILRRVFTVLMLQYEYWLNRTQLPILIHDIRHPLPFPDESFQACYSSHVLEHLYRQDALKLLQETSRVLVSGGILRVVVPDLRAIVERYINTPEGSLDIPPAEKLNTELLYHRPLGPQGPFWQRIRELNNEFHTHKWMYDFESLSYIVKQAGYIDIQERDYLDSQIPVVPLLSVVEQ